MVMLSQIKVKPRLIYDVLIDDTFKSVRITIDYNIGT